MPYLLAATLLSAATLAPALASGPPAGAQDRLAVARGAALFAGHEALSAKIRDHIRDLPSSVVACDNCHARQPRSQTLPNQAPVLDPVSLLTATSRRNGPISAYDQASFCRVLRTGIDPRSVMLARAMPLFTVSLAQCASLWAFLTTRPPS